MLSPLEFPPPSDIPIKKIKSAKDSTFEISSAFDNRDDLVLSPTDDLLMNDLEIIEKHSGLTSKLLKSANEVSKLQKLSSDQKLHLDQIVSSEEDKILKQETSYDEETKEIYQHFNDLQPIANEFGMNLRFLELVVIGCQSDGKSSFIEALLGFQFNIVAAEIGTRRPLILQMINDQTCQRPNCTFFKEELSELEETTTPAENLEQEIKRRTTEVCGRISVSSRPIILRIRYKHCSNLTIIDTPGFRKQHGPSSGNTMIGATEEVQLADKIHRMVLNLIKHPHRLIICLEQSTVEWVFNFF